jgi:hypothetical protein
VTKLFDDKRRREGRKMMQKGGVERVLTLVRHKTGQVVEALRVTALEFSWDLRDAAHGGFGVPKLISSAASLSVAVSTNTHTRIHSLFVCVYGCVVFTASSRKKTSKNC